MVVFDNSLGELQANKSQYRKFKIKTVQGANDVGAMKEVLIRRFRNNWARPNLVILDLMLPGIQGLEVCKRIRKVPETAAIPIIMLTAKGEEIDRVRDDSIPQAELAKAKNQYRAGVVRQRQTSMGVAEALHSALWFDGSLESANTEIERHLAVTTADLRRVAQRYLAPENRLTLIVNPPAQQGGN